MSFPSIRQVHFEPCLYSGWFSGEGLWVIGSAFFGDEYLHGAGLHAHFHTGAVGSLHLAAEKLNGHFAAVRITPGGLEVVMDHVRSYPCFYGFEADRLVVSDDASYVQNECNTYGADPVGQAEFLRTGQLVTGQQTLYEGLFQTQAAEGLWFRLESPVVTTRWTEYRHHEDADLDEAEVARRLDAAVLESTQRLITVAGDDPIVLPLSGGYDSRLLLLSLRRLGHTNIITFTYGRAGNHEAQISEKVAASLGVTWHFVPYSTASWRRWANSPAASTQHRHAHHLSVLPHVQDAPAIQILTEKGLIPQGALVAPGHSGDVHAGSQLTPTLMEGPLSEAGLHAVVLAKYFRFNAADLPAQIEGDVMAERIRASTLLKEPVTRETLGDAMERWFWQERLAKFLSNSVRNYEQHGLRFWLPLWDRAFTDVWMEVPLKFRYGQNLYQDYVNDQWTAFTGEPAPAVAPKKPVRPQSALRRWVARGKCASIARAYLRNPMGWYGLLSPFELLTMKRPNEHINAHLTRRIVKRRKG